MIGTWRGKGPSARNEAALVIWVTGAVAWWQKIMNVASAHPKLALAIKAVQLPPMNGGGEDGGPARLQQIELDVEFNWRLRNGQGLHQGGSKNIHYNSIQ